MPSIIVNGRPFECQDDHITYDAIVNMARAGDDRPAPTMTITYHWRGPMDMTRQGIITTSSQPVKLEPGMRFEAVQIS
jgi:hypothetical protein